MKKFFKRLIILVFAILLLGGSLFFGSGYIYYKKVTNDVSIEEKVASIQQQPQYAVYEVIDKDFLNAIVAIEDRRFYEHSGIEYRSLLRAAISNFIAKDIRGGGSTITQQLAKNMYFDYKPSYLRKVSEMFVARDLEKRYSKEEILELYVNIINYGDNHIGITEATLGYFQKYPANLTFDEATLLAGLPQSPGNYQLSNHYDRALRRQRQVIKAMEAAGYL